MAIEVIHLHTLCRTTKVGVTGVSGHRTQMNFPASKTSAKHTLVRGLSKENSRNSSGEGRGVSLQHCTRG